MKGPRSALILTSLNATNQGRNRGVIIDSDLHFSNRLTAMTKSAYYHLKNVAQNEGFLSQQNFSIGLITVMMSTGFKWGGDNQAVVADPKGCCQSPYKRLCFP